MKQLFLVFFFAASVAQAQTITEYFNEFPFKPLNITVDSMNSHLIIDVDQKNAFVDVAYYDAEYRYGGNFQFTYFVKADKSKVFALSHYYNRPGYNGKEFGFYTKLNGQWTTVKSSLIPKIILSDFDPQSPWIDSLGTRYSIDITLPREGTDLKLNVAADEEHQINYYTAEYEMYIRSFPDLILEWNREKGVFEKRKRVAELKE